MHIVINVKRDYRGPTRSSPGAGFIGDPVERLVIYCLSSFVSSCSNSIALFKVFTLEGCNSLKNYSFVLVI